MVVGRYIFKTFFTGELGVIKNRSNGNLTICSCLATGTITAFFVYTYHVSGVRVKVPNSGLHIGNKYRYCLTSELGQKQTLQQFLKKSSLARSFQAKKHVKNKNNTNESIFMSDFCADLQLLLKPDLL